MNYLNKDKKIMIAILVISLIISICYYIYSQNVNFLTVQEQDLQIKEEELEESIEKSQNFSNEKISMIIVHVSGAVNQEGIVEISENSRIADAIEKAGGLKEDACIDKINLAYMLEDGMKIHIPTKEEEKENSNNESISNDNNFYITDSIESILVSKENTSDTEKQATKVDINTAMQEDLESLPGIGPTTALKIINYRNENGKFKSIEDIKEVSGIGDSKFNNIRDLICVK